MANRENILNDAKAAICGERAKDYGSVQDNFALIAEIWGGLLGIVIEPEQVAGMMIAIKLARLVNSPGHRDSWVDIAGYAALGAEVACP